MPIDMETRELLDFAGQTLGFRFDYHGHSLVLSGDTRPSDNLVEHARGVDVLVHEAQYASPGASDEAKLANVSLSVHTEPKDAASVSARAKPKMAVYSHLIPPQITEEELKAATPYDGTLIVAHDLMMITIGDTIEISDRPILKDESFEKSKVLKKPESVRPVGGRDALKKLDELLAFHWNGLVLEHDLARGDLSIVEFLVGAVIRP